MNRTRKGRGLYFQMSVLRRNLAADANDSYLTATRKIPKRTKKRTKVSHTMNRLVRTRRENRGAKQTKSIKFVQQGDKKPALLRNPTHPGTNFTNIHSSIGVVQTPPINFKSRVALQVPAGTTKGNEWQQPSMSNIGVTHCMSIMTGFGELLQLPGSSNTAQWNLQQLPERSNSEDVCWTSASSSFAGVTCISGFPCSSRCGLDQFLSFTNERVTQWCPVPPSTGTEKYLPGVANVPFSTVRGENYPSQPVSTWNLCTSRNSYTDAAEYPSGFYCAQCWNEGTLYQQTWLSDDRVSQWTSISTDNSGVHGLPIGQSPCCLEASVHDSQDVQQMPTPSSVAALKRRYKKKNVTLLQKVLLKSFRQKVSNEEPIDVMCSLQPNYAHPSTRVCRDQPIDEIPSEITFLMAENLKFFLNLSIEHKLLNCKPLPLAIRESFEIED